MKPQTKTYTLPANLFLVWFAKSGQALRQMSHARFCIVALSPAIFSVLSATASAMGGQLLNVRVLWSVAGACSVVCGFWIAGRHCAHRLNFVITGTMISLLLFAVNWIIMAEGCCGTMR